jgi:glutathione synthase/RimK-type ligase-like ATP-grasp enzyme
MPQEVLIRIGIVQTFEPGERWTYGWGFALSDLGAEWIPIEARYLRVPVDGNGGPRLLIEGDPDLEQQTIADLHLDCIVWRVSEGDFLHFENIFLALSATHLMVNTWDCVWTCSDKWRTSAKLARAGIPVIPTVPLIPEMEVPSFGKYKTVVKPSVGASGIGVRVASAGETVDSTVPYIAQPLAPGPSKEHIRVIVCGVEPVASIHRIPGPQHLGNEIEVNNVAAGGTPAPAPLEPVRDLAIRVAQCIESDVIGIDFVPWNDGFAVLEVNSSPGFNGIKEALGVDCFESAAAQTVKRVEATRG